MWHVWGRKNGYRVFWGKSEGKRPLERPRRICDIIKMDSKEMGWEGVDCIPVVLDTHRVVEEICCEGIDWTAPSQDRMQWRYFVSALMSLDFS